MAALVPFIPIITGAAAAVSTVMAVKGARDARKARERQAAIEEQNRLAQEKQTRIQLAQQEREQRLRIGSIRARGGGQGRGVAGNVLDLIGDTVTQGMLERKFMAESGGIKAANFGRQAEAFRSAGRSEFRTGMLNASQQLLGGITSTATAFQRVN